MTTSTRNNTELSLIDLALRDQQELRTPVVSFSEKFDHGDNHQFSELIPLSKPKAGEQYAFQVDLDKCTGCKSCVTACHNLNGLDVKEAWRDAGKIIRKGNEGISHQQTVTTACHHCDDPACMNGCPVLAYEKDPVTGIVRHLDDQCIGCQYCVLKCPYDVPKFNKKLGIVRKCDMCHNRLETGEAPACVQACPNEAIKIVNVSRQQINLQSEGPFLPGTPKPSYTKPATQYISSKKIPEDMIAADKYKNSPQEAHLPLVFMLIFTQMAIGFYTLGYLLNLFSHINISGMHLSGVTFLLTAAGIGFSTMHLGKPLKAWKAFLGVRKSWMSREVLAFAGVLKLSLISTLLHAFPQIPVPALTQPILHILILLFGLTSVFASVKLYEDTRRELWQLKYTGVKFFSTMLMLGAAGILNYLLITKSVTSPLLAVYLTFGIGVVALYKLGTEKQFLAVALHKEYSIAKKSALLIKEKLYTFQRIRFITAGLAIVVLFLGQLLSITMQQPIVSLFAGNIALGLLLLSELCERYLFFTAVDAPKMPGEM